MKKVAEVLWRIGACDLMVIGLVLSTLDRGAGFYTKNGSWRVWTQMVSYFLGKLQFLNRWSMKARIENSGVVYTV